MEDNYFNNKDAKLYFDRGNVMYVEEDYKSAIEDFNYSLELDANFAKVYLLEEMQNLKLKITLE